MGTVIGAVEGLAVFSYIIVTAKLWELDVPEASSTLPFVWLALAMVCGHVLAGISVGWSVAVLVVQTGVYGTARLGRAQHAAAIGCALACGLVYPLVALFGGFMGFSLGGLAAMMVWEPLYPVGAVVGLWIVVYFCALSSAFVGAAFGAISFGCFAVFETGSKMFRSAN